MRSFLILIILDLEYMLRTRTPKFQTRKLFVPRREKAQPFLQLDLSPAQAS